MSLENIKSIGGDRAFLEGLVKKREKFVLLSSYTDTVEIEGISKAGLPGHIEYTPALDMELIYYGMAKTLEKIALMPEGPPTPALITRVIRELLGFKMYFVDVGLRVAPKTPCIKVDASPSKSILEGAKVESRRLYEEGRQFGREWLSGGDDEVLVLLECVPGGTTTAYGVSKALGYKMSDKGFSSSASTNEVYNLKQGVVEQALNKFSDKVNDVFDAIHYFGDNVQAFLSGIVVELSKSQTVILGGGTQMAAIYGILNKLDEEINYENIAIMTTKWIVNDKNSDICKLLEEINSKGKIYYTDFDFISSEYNNLRLYEEGNVKEGAGAGASLVYGYLRGLSKDMVGDGVDKLYSKMLL